MNQKKGQDAGSRGNIVLTGFMGTGKSAAGKVLAKRLGWEFIDTDDLITRRAGKDIPAIFRDEGDGGFRDREREAISSLAGRSALVISTGGGAVTNPGNLPRLRSLGPVILLRAVPETVLRRVGKGKNRPLLAGAQGPAARLERIRDLLERRKKAYAAGSDAAVDTDGKTIGAVVTAILAEVDRLPRPKTEGPAGVGGA